MFPWSSQDELAQKQKLKDEKKALEQAKTKAAQKGPMGRHISPFFTCSLI